MTNEEAKKVLEEQLKYALFTDTTSAMIPTDVVKVAIDAIERQIPQEPFETYDDDTCIYKHFECPNCGERQSRHASIVYCMNCGQAINWRKNL